MLFKGNILMKNCKQCSQGFEIMDKDNQFYDKISVPEPTLCPDCRRQRRLAWRNEDVLFQGTCDLCHEKTFSIYPEKTSFPVYCIKCWWGDKWDPLDYGRDFDFNRNFFEQFAELQKKVPRMTLLQSKNENSDYTNCVSHLKDCYLLFSSDFNQNCLYGIWIEKCKDCVDNLIIDSCQLTYEAIFSQNIFNSKFILFSSQCSDSAFLLDCKNCSNCLMCYGLRNKEYHIANKPYSKEEYFKKIKEFPLSSYNNLQSAKKHFFDIVKKATNPHIRKKGNIFDSTGDFLANTQNCLDCYDLNESRDCRYILGGFGLKDAYDCCYVNGELGYENCECVPMPFNSIGCVNTYTGSDLKYCDTCMNNCKNLIGCIGLKHAEYAIFNKKYSKEEYEVTLQKLIDHMKKTGEYGEFFPIKFSPFHYNSTEAQENYPLAKDECLAKGYQWKEKNKQDYQPQIYKIPDEIKNVGGDITKEILACSDCGRNYKILIQELKFYMNLGLAVPRKCFYCRHKDRMALKNSRKLYERKCDKCGIDIRTTYSPDRPEKVYCEKCYLKEVY
jgi:hypothetical protein